MQTELQTLTPETVRACAAAGADAFDAVFRMNRPERPNHSWRELPAEYQARMQHAAEQVLLSGPEADAPLVAHNAAGRSDDSVEHFDRWDFRPRWAAFVLAVRAVAAGEQPPRLPRTRKLRMRLLAQATPAQSVPAIAPYRPAPEPATETPTAPETVTVPDTQTTETHDEPAPVDPARGDDRALAAEYRRRAERLRRGAERYDDHDNTRFADLCRSQAAAYDRDIDALEAHAGPADEAAGDWRRAAMRRAA